jgi:hypothetical protein
MPESFPEPPEPESFAVPPVPEPLEPESFAEPPVPESLGPGSFCSPDPWPQPAPRPREQNKRANRIARMTNDPLPEAFRDSLR